MSFTLDKVKCMFYTLFLCDFHLNNNKWASFHNWFSMYMRAFRNKKPSKRKAELEKKVFIYDLWVEDLRILEKICPRLIKNQEQNLYGQAGSVIAEECIFIL